MIRNVQRFFSDSDSAQPEALVLGRVSDRTPHSTRKRGRRFLTHKVEKNDVTISPDVLSNVFERSRIWGQEAQQQKRQTLQRPEMK